MLTNVGWAQADVYPLRYKVTIDAAKKAFHVLLVLPDPKLINTINFNLEHSQCFDFQSTNTLERKAERLLWYPEGKSAILRYSCKVAHVREKQNGTKAYDAYITNNWALFRGDDLVPPARVLAKKGARAQARLEFILPEHWQTVHTGWMKDKSLKEKDAGNKYARTFLIDNPERKFDRPTGWMIAGNLGTRIGYVQRSADESDEILVSAPLDSSMRRMDTLAFVQLLWPQLVNAFAVSPERLLLVGGNDPLWRGGLSAGNSMFLHSDRPLISENSTSSLVHELVHVFTGLQGKKNHDWIAEGIAEFYSFTLLRRMGAYDEYRMGKIYSHLEQRGKGVKTLLRKQSSGKTTVAAVLLFRELDEEIATLTRGEKGLDDLVRLVMKKKKVDAQDLETAFVDLCGKPSQTLKSPLLKPPAK